MIQAASIHTSISATLLGRDSSERSWRNAEAKRLAFRAKPEAIRAAGTVDVYGVDVLACAAVASTMFRVRMLAA
jgi:hypothetical protein